MKKCRTCKAEKEEDLFSFTNKRKGIRSGQCKECDKAYKKKYYNENKVELIAYSVVKARDTRNRNRQFVWDYLKSHPCIDCGESDPIVLEFDHQKDKLTNITQLVIDCASIKKIITEIKKCEVRCANCHRRKTARDFNWYDNISR